MNFIFDNETNGKELKINTWGCAKIIQHSLYCLEQNPDSKLYQMIKTSYILYR